jgi:small-conductance mechanosensitive channel
MTGIPAEILAGLWRAALATIVLIAVLWGMSRLYPRLYAAIERLRRSKRASVRIQKLELLSADRLSIVLMRIARLSRAALTLLAFYIYIPLVLSFFPWTAPYAEPVVEWAVTPFVSAWVAFLGYLPSLFWLAAIIVITRWGLQLIKSVFTAIREGTITVEGFYPDWADPTYKIVTVLVFAFALVVAFPYLPGSSSDAFKGVSLFLGVLFSLGSSSAVANVVAGVVLTYTRAFKVGDYIRLGVHTGRVIERTLLVTRLRTPKEVEVTIPNASVLAGDVQNFTVNALDTGLVLHTEVTIGYDAPWRTVHELLIAAATRTPDIVQDPPPFVHQTALGDFSVKYELNAYTRKPEQMPAIFSQLHAEIQDAFARAGMEIMSPIYEARRDGPSTVPPPPPETASAP